MRARVGGGGSASETAQAHVWLEGDDHRYALRIGGELDRLLEEESCALLRDAHASRKRVSLGYRFRGGRREISALWVQR
ncbi:MAG: hypothetical protein ACRDNG_03295 [Gaiellaceae bacterium]